MQTAYCFWDCYKGQAGQLLTNSSLQSPSRFLSGELRMYSRKLVNEGHMDMDPPVRLQKGPFSSKFKIFVPREFKIILLLHLVIFKSQLERYDITSTLISQVMSM